MYTHTHALRHAHVPPTHTHTHVHTLNVKSYFKEVLLMSDWRIWVEEGKAKLVRFRESRVKETRENDAVGFYTQCWLNTQWNRLPRN